MQLWWDQAVRSFKCRVSYFGAGIAKFYCEVALMTNYML